jgi:hypothetical protein
MESRMTRKRANSRTGSNARGRSIATRDDAGCRKSCATYVSVRNWAGIRRILSMRIEPRTRDFNAEELDKCAVLLPTLGELS